jgi:hypothetical protein
MLPLKTTALEIFESAFDPGAELVPANICLFRQQISQDQAGFSITFGPGSQQRTQQGPFLEAINAAAPMGARSGHHR